MLLEKKLKFTNILENMRHSTKGPAEADEAAQLQQSLEALRKENRELTLRLEAPRESEQLELKAARKELKKLKKLHEADLNVLANLQSVGR